MKRPIIGLIAKHIKSDNIRTDSLIRDEYKQAIFDNGGIAIGILSPNSEIMFISDYTELENHKLDVENITDQIKLCDGIILLGGSETEAWELFIAGYCYDNDIPCLGICAGQNNIARAMGGSVTKISNPEDHDKPYDDYVHSINVIDTNSKFYSIVNTTQLMVNSRHKNTIDECPKLDVVAVSSEGYKEVIESKEKTFYMGVRFHPESLYKTDENMNNIFKYFLEACRIKMDEE